MPSTTAAERDQSAAARRPDYHEIFEQDARWVMGPALLGDVIQFFRDKSPMVQMNLADPSRFDMSLPVPTGVESLVPPELEAVFAACLSSTLMRWMSHRGQDGRTPTEMLEANFIGRPSTRSTVVQVNSALRVEEGQRQAWGEGELWQIASEEFGFGPFPPMPGGMVKLTAGA